MSELSNLDVDSLLTSITGRPTPEIIPDLVTDNTPQEGHRWALDCYWAYENMGSRITKASAGTSARFALWAMAKKNPEMFVTQIMPRAMGFLEKARTKNADSESVVKKEEKKIAELQEILRGAIEESRYNA